jgi:hypothetical protein
VVTDLAAQVDDLVVALRAAHFQLEVVLELVLNLCPVFR